MSIKLEIERKFLVKKAPANLTQYPVEKMEQGYFEEDGLLVRIRKTEKNHWRTTKSQGSKVRIEDEEEITVEEFDSLWLKTDGRRIEKERWSVPLNNLTIELDIFGGKLKGLITAEVEFVNEEESNIFVPPDWFGQEVTEDEDYKNYNLASKGLPQK